MELRCSLILRCLRRNKSHVNPFGIQGRCVNANTQASIKLIIGEAEFFSRHCQLSAIAMLPISNPNSHALILLYLLSYRLPYEIN